MRYAVGIAATVAVAASLAAPRAEAQTESDVPFAAGLALEIQALREDYEARIRALEEQLEALRSGSPGKPTGHDDHGHAPHDDMGARAGEGGAPDVSIAAVLRGMVTSHSAEDSAPAGFRLGHESERPPEGFSLGHSELVLSSQVSDALQGTLTLGVGAHPGEPTELELEEAYIRTLSGAGLPPGLSLTAGRALWNFGYLNERHAHEDDFSDRPLPYRAFLDGAYNDDGVELALSLPGSVRTEVGGGLFRGDDLPFGGSDTGRRAWSAFARVGGDMGRDSSWRIGASILGGQVIGGAGGHAHEEDAHGEEAGHADEMDDHADEMDDHADEMDDHADEMDDHADEMDDHADEDFAPSDFFYDGMFTGDRQLLGADVRYAWSPTGDARQTQLILQGEHFWQTDAGTYTLEEHTLASDGSSAGWYAQAVYKVAPEWRLGVRYARLRPSNMAETDHDPSAVAVMGDWTTSRFGQVRLQYNRESMTGGEEDNQLILQYTVSLGGHAGHDH